MASTDPGLREDLIKCEMCGSLLERGEHCSVTSILSIRRFDGFHKTGRSLEATSREFLCIQCALLDLQSFESLLSGERK
jgi:hypothetical protein